MEKRDSSEGEQLVPQVGKWWRKWRDGEQAKTQKRRDGGERCELERGGTACSLSIEIKDKFER